MSSDRAVQSLDVNDVSVTYSNGHQAIRHASFSLTGGTICALVGVNGSGKSTLFKSIMGLVKPTSGQVLLNQQPIYQALKQNRVAYVPQTEDVDWNFPVLVSDVVMMGRYGRMNFLRIPSKQDRAIVAESLERVGLSTLQHRQIGELSGGQKKRVFLARALAQQGSVLLLDEPFTGVDVKTENAIIDLLRTLRDEGHLILVATHNLGSVPEFCDNVILVNRTVLAAGPTHSTFTQSNLEKTFGGVLRHINLGGSHLHDDDDVRSVTVLTDDERPAVFYGSTKSDPPASRVIPEEKQP
ncbi:MULTISPECIES: manganese/iron ABC transporter ATP-binding protein [Pectobacterium]|uniref:Manganese/iron ABC transporter ATP-binding protein n=1 Tax=Pectobacterium aquaticum TaxID=2204145 RepID=A0AA93ANU6_9GAMM|nr:MULTISPECIES: manganese/iron ABC transporter ATP-binding protein [Pectobacterium]PLY37578.1 iron ABC transporter permease [Pectobacterium carotovorum]RRN97625.1 manganese/iron ABC transporter ATP-binding protein [Pectobacterium aquaticum]RRO00178.1 manganese/iron ABC transporter ATP-binding protein [Pectobacterium aquaticum]RRO08231.1 manganese/iron ABC transporter ATP-binding protein [Pectobacterium aquaticum]RRO11683.1 manganese/iron ABC transporter ATP-binding protein [Pectobacterium aqu